MEFIVTINEPFKQWNVGGKSNRSSGCLMWDFGDKGNAEMEILLHNSRVGDASQGEQLQTTKMCMAKISLKQRMRERLEAKKAKERQ